MLHILICAFSLTTTRKRQGILVFKTVVFMLTLFGLLFFDGPVWSRADVYWYIFGIFKYEQNVKLS